MLTQLTTFFRLSTASDWSFTFHLHLSIQNVLLNKQKTARERTPASSPIGLLFERSIAILLNEHKPPTYTASEKGGCSPLEYARPVHMGILCATMLLPFCSEWLERLETKLADKKKVETLGEFL